MDDLCIQLYSIGPSTLLDAKPRPFTLTEHGVRLDPLYASSTPLDAQSYTHAIRMLYADSKSFTLSSTPRSQGSGACPLSVYTAVSQYQQLVPYSSLCTILYSLQLRAQRAENLRAADTFGRSGHHCFTARTGWDWVCFARTDEILLVLPLVQLYR